jgi:hypothetical protein
LETQLAKLKVELGKPQHGWLAVELRVGDFCLAFNASRVLDDPLTGLVSCLLLVVQGVDALVVGASRNFFSIQYSTAKH